MDWSIRELKKSARRQLKGRLMAAVSVCFLLAVLTDAYPLASAFINQYIPDSTNTRVLADYFASNAHLVDGISELFHAEFFSRNQLDLSSLRAFDWLINIFTASYLAVFSMFRLARGFLHHLTPAELSVLILGTVFAWIYQIFGSNLLIVGEKRFFLEQRLYPDTKIRRVFLLYRLPAVTRPAWILLCRNIYQILWSFTIVGGLIKKYEYTMIPYILAENPRISRKEAFFLTKQLTRGHKWHIFLFQLSFIGWRILAFFTFGLTSILIVNPYVACAEAELYAHLRTQYVLARKKGYEYLNDPVLFRKMSEDELLISKALYDDTGGPYSKNYAPLLHMDDYPVFMYPIQPRHRLFPGDGQPVRQTAASAFFCFCLFSMTGWLIRNLLSLLQAGLLYTPLYFTGPMSLMYGFCGLILLFVFRKRRKKPYLVFGFSVLFYAVVQILLAVMVQMYLPVSFASRQYFLSVNEQIYWKGNIIFALACCAFVYFLAPRWCYFFGRMSPLKRRLLLILMFCLLLLSLAGTAGTILPFLFSR